MSDHAAADARDAQRTEPFIPRLQWCVEQPGLRQLAQCHWQAAIVEARAADGEDILLRQLLSVQTRPMAAAIAHRHVDIVRAEVGKRLPRADVDVDIGMPAVEVRQTRNKPMCREGRQNADSQCTLWPGPQRSDTADNAIERVADDGSKVAALLGQFHPTATTN